MPVRSSQVEPVCHYVRRVLRCTVLCPPWCLLPADCGCCCWCLVLQDLPFAICLLTAHRFAHSPSDWDSCLYLLKLEMASFPSSLGPLEKETALSPGQRAIRAPLAVPSLSLAWSSSNVPPTAGVRRRKLQPVRQSIVRCTVNFFLPTCRLDYSSTQRTLM